MHHLHLSEIINLPGVADLPAQVRWLFARSLKAESEGNTKQAENLLELAIDWALNFARANFSHKEEARMESAEYKEVPLEKLIIGPYNLRGEKAEESPKLRLLKDSIWEEGLLHPLGVINNGDGTYTVVYGHRRFWAIDQYLKEVMPMLPVRIIPKEQADEVKAIRIALAENAIRESLNPIALAKKLRALRDAGLTNKDIAEDVGFESAGSVTDVMKLLQLEPEAQDALIAGTLSRSYGKALLPLIANREQQLQALAEIEKLDKKERSVRRAEKIVEGIKTGRGWYQLPLALPEAAALQELANNRHKLTIEFGTVTELRQALTDILEHNTEPSLKYINPNQEPDDQVT
jgi:ParB/RepB/Spo0J family partition protein